ncbi:MAG: S-methyl-5-thioribose-1-phosphate isomerase [Melioribacteraceae bacterium]|nr:S-methyl-5-thioribose-1-phosphate isomerase [Melioribacteraceae bacterium]MCF8355196.1 S-methyl-5-thioribose-1-phosphate isomerase [Melioribacteraceae bacterium]MCF8396182.1 S-methyl-5-thioribose-1-phosphate isomerase [Melioribacteraceae bacterium]MCF8419885.1 S-methyl-5-thioribose-1-phosphate isomerase [Melioribacteraceae bacterium]
MNDFKSIEFVDDKLIILDQTKLPLEEEYIVTDNLERIAQSIERLEIRGAPAIGITAAYGLSLYLKNKNENIQEEFDFAFNRLAETRPTAVNLFWALHLMKTTFEESIDKTNLYEILLKRAKEIHQDDIDKCEGMAQNGLKIFEKKSRVLTHCNTGILATGGNGTALAVIKRAFENGLVSHVHADETRPLLQGSRLTAFELEKAGIPFSINTDSSAAYLMQHDKVDLVITGADRIAKNGDAANKIGTYNLAVLCNYHNIPFYIAAPTSTIDKECADGGKIKIEQRNKKEITHINNHAITKEKYDVSSPAFDVTPNKLITAIITEESIHYPPYDF